MKNIFLNACCYLCFVFVVFFVPLCKAQPNLYGIRNSGLTYQFVSINCSNDSLEVLNNLNINFYTPKFSSCYDHSNHRYFYCTGQIMFILDVLSGTMIDSINFSTIHPSFLQNIVYNPVDGFIYGIKMNIGTLVQNFTRFNPSNGNLNNVQTLSQQIDVGVASKSVINMEKLTYVNQSTKIAVIDIRTGNILSNSQIQNVSSETFDHMAFSCKLQSYIGLSNNPIIPEEYLSTVQELNPVVSHINTSAIPVSYYKNYQSGCSIDNDNDIYFFTATGGNIYGIDINSGQVVYSHTFPGFEFLFLESGSSYSCPISETIDKSNDVELFPNPTSDKINIQSNNQINSISVYTIDGQEILLMNKLDDGIFKYQIELNGLSPDLYFMKVVCDNQTYLRKFIVR